MRVARCHLAILFQCNSAYRDTWNVSLLSGSDLPPLPKLHNAEGNCDVNAESPFEAKASVKLSFVVVAPLVSVSTPPAYIVIEY